MMKHRIRHAWNTLINPDVELVRYKRLKFESIIGNYLLLLLVSGCLAGFVVFAANVVRSTFYDLAYNADVVYSGVFNYAIGLGIGTLYVYVFLGTIGLFIIGLFIKPFYKNKLIDIYSMLAYASMPMLVFAWLPIINLSLIIWCVVLFIKAYKSY